MSAKTRQEILHVFNAELVYIRTNFPMGKTGPEDSRTAL